MEVTQEVFSRRAAATYGVETEIYMPEDVLSRFYTFSNRIDCGMAVAFSTQALE